VGYSQSKSREFNHWFQSILLSNPLPPSMPRVIKYLQLMRGFTPDFDYTRELVRPSFKDLRTDYDQLRKEGGKSPILFHPFSSHGRYGKQKEWGEKNLIHFLNILAQEVNHPIRITWGPGELERAKKVTDQLSHSNVKTAVETKTLKDLAYQVQNAFFVISVDTSVAHVADLMGKPLVVLFGGSNHYVNGPIFTNYRIITPDDTDDLTRDISPRRVLNTINELKRTL
jgi:ADP-heptose:LPS heptosyltransferase